MCFGGVSVYSYVALRVKCFCGCFQRLLHNVVCSSNGKIKKRIVVFLWCLVYSSVAMCAIVYICVFLASVA